MDYYWTDTTNTYKRKTKPNAPTVNGNYVPDTSAGCHHLYPCESLLERARRLDIIDEWRSILKVRMQGSVRLTFESKRADSLWKAWCSKQYAKTKS